MKLYHRTQYRAHAKRAHADFKTVLQACENKNKNASIRKQCFLLQEAVFLFSMPNSCYDPKSASCNLALSFCLLWQGITLREQNCKTPAPASGKTCLEAARSVARARPPGEQNSCGCLQNIQACRDQWVNGEGKHGCNMPNFHLTFLMAIHWTEAQICLVWLRRKLLKKYMVGLHSLALFRPVAFLTRA